MADYLADVRKYDATADEDIVNKIVKHLLGISSVKSFEFCKS